MTDTKIPQDVIDDAKAAGFTTEITWHEFQTKIAKFAALRDQRRQAVPDGGKFIDVWRKYMPAPSPRELNLYNWCERFWQDGRAAPTLPASNEIVWGVVGHDKNSALLPTVQEGALG